MTAFASHTSRDQPNVDGSNLNVLDWDIILEPINSILDQSLSVTLHEQTRSKDLHATGSTDQNGQIDFATELLNWDFNEPTSSNSINSIASTIAPTLESNSSQNTIGHQLANLDTSTSATTLAIFPDNFNFTPPELLEAMLKCPYPLCQSQITFKRPCDLNRHYRSHFRSYFCRLLYCSICTTTTGGTVDQSPRRFGTRKDRDRHEQANFPGFCCSLCGKLCSRKDNLANHYRKCHFDIEF